MEIFWITCAINVSIWLFIIANQLRNIAGSLEKIAQTSESDLRISVPGNKEVRIDLPNGGEIIQTATREARP